MPRTDNPYDNRPVDPSGPRPVEFAERALLGALVIAPQQLRAVSFLEPVHLGNPAHGTLLVAMRAVPPPEPDAHARNPAWLNAVLHAARPQAGLTVPYLHTLIQACPRPEHAAAYARMIVADHARRTLLVHAEQLADAVTDTTAPDPAAAVLAQADTLTRFLDDLAGRTTPHPGSLPRTPSPSAPPRDTNEEVLEEERLLLASATAHPSDLQRMRWLQPDDFALPLHGGLFQCVTALAHRGDPIDPVTVLGEAQYRGLLATDITPAEMIAVLSRPDAPPEHWGERILRRALLAQAHATAQRIRTCAEDLSNTPHQLVTGSRRALADLNALRARWHRTAPQPPSSTARPPTPRTEATSRAGPSALRTTAAPTAVRPAR